VDSLLRLIEAFDFEVDTVSSRLQAQLAGEAGYQALLALPGVGPVLAGIFVAEIGQVHRFPTARHLCSWAGLTPRHHESDTTVRRGSITKQGSKLVRWAAIEAVQKLGTDAGWLVSNGPGSPNAAAVTSPPSRSPASCSHWSTTACATGTSAPSPRRWWQREQARTRPGARPFRRSDPRPGGVIAPLIDPARPRS
jgi:Transposase IS116/IS110/IS902 family